MYKGIKVNLIISPEIKNILDVVWEMHLILWKQFVYFRGFCLILSKYLLCQIVLQLKATKQT